MKFPRLVITDLDEVIAELVGKTYKKTLAIWVANCAERALPYFEKKYPEDKRPRVAIETLRDWIKTGVFKMAVIRKASLDSHAAARLAADKNLEAMSAARACGQAVATAHVPAHSIAAARYAATAIRDATDSLDAVDKERKWQYQHLLELLK